MTILRLGVRGFMKDKDGNRADSNMMEAQTSPDSNTRFFIRLRGGKSDRWAGCFCFISDMVPGLSK